MPKPDVQTDFFYCRMGGENENTLEYATQLQGPYEPVQGDKLKDKVVFLVYPALFEDKLMKLEAMSAQDLLGPASAQRAFITFWQKVKEHKPKVIAHPLKVEGGEQAGFMVRPYQSKDSEELVSLIEWSYPRKDSDDVKPLPDDLNRIAVLLLRGSVYPEGDLRSSRGSSNAYQELHKHAALQEKRENPKGFDLFDDTNDSEEEGSSLFDDPRSTRTPDGFSPNPRPSSGLDTDENSDFSGEEGSSLFGTNSNSAGAGDRPAGGSSSTGVHFNDTGATTPAGSAYGARLVGGFTREQFNAVEAHWQAVPQANVSLITSFPREQNRTDAIKAQSGDEQFTLTKPKRLGMYGTTVTVVSERGQAGRIARGFKNAFRAAVQSWLLTEFGRDALDEQGVLKPKYRDQVDASIDNNASDKEREVMTNVMTELLNLPAPAPTPSF